VPLHDYKAWGALLAFAADFKPETFILGGDILDCGAVSHHNKGKPRRTEGFRLLQDAVECEKNVIEEIDRLVTGRGRKVYLRGNHEDWLEDVMDEDPALDGMFDIAHLLNLKGYVNPRENWEVPEFSDVVREGKLHFIHGHEVSGGEHVAKSAVVNYERSIRFGHHHTYQTYTKTSAVDQKLAKTGTAVPCLCSKGPKYGEGKPNRWVQGFNFGYIEPNGTFTDFIAIILEGKFHWNGKVYRG
jgi:hypothetical protein